MLSTGVKITKKKKIQREHAIIRELAERYEVKVVDNTNLRACYGKDHVY